MSVPTRRQVNLGVGAWLRTLLLAERISLRLLEECDRGREILRTLIERAEKVEDVVRRQAIDEVALRHVALVPGRQQQKLGASPSVNRPSRGFMRDVRADLNSCRATFFLR